MSEERIPKQLKQVSIVSNKVLNSVISQILHSEIRQNFSNSEALSGVNKTGGFFLTYIFLTYIFLTNIFLTDIFSTWNRGFFLTNIFITDIFITDIFITWKTEIS